MYTKVFQNERKMFLSVPFPFCHIGHHTRNAPGIHPPSSPTERHPLTEMDHDWALSTLTNRAWLWTVNRILDRMPPVRCPEGASRASILGSLQL